MEITAEKRGEILGILKIRFEKNRRRHEGILWDEVQAAVEAADKLWPLSEMERTGGEPDVVRRDGKTGEFVFIDCSEESPKGRRSLCYDREALESRKENRPLTSVMDMAASMGVELLTEEEYRELQKSGTYDTKTSSWIRTPPDIRKLGGAVFADFRYGHVFVYHNGAESYYSSRGFRASLRVTRRLSKIITAGSRFIAADKKQPPFERS